MTDKIAKKWAKAYIEGRYPNNYSTEIRYSSVDTKEYTEEYAILPTKVWKWVYKYAYRLGWDGCHWDDPLILWRETYCRDEKLVIFKCAAGVQYDRDRSRVWKECSWTVW